MQRVMVPLFEPIVRVLQVMQRVMVPLVMPTVRVLQVMKPVTRMLQVSTG